MPKVVQAHLDARRQQIVDAARARFAEHGFAGTSMADIVAESGLSTGAIYRYFKSKDEIVVAVCGQSREALPRTLAPEALEAFLERLRTLAREHGHARLTVQIYAEAAISPSLAAVVQKQLAVVRSAIAELVRTQQPRPDAPDQPDEPDELCNSDDPDSPAGPESHHGRDPEAVAEAFIAVCNGFCLQLAVRGDLDPAPFAAALTAVIGRPSTSRGAVRRTG